MNTALLLVALTTSTPAVAPPERDRGVTVAKIAFGVTSAWDLSTSMFQLGRHPNDFREANVLLRPFENAPIAFASVKSALAIGTLLAASEVAKDHPRAAKWVLWIAAGVNAFVAIHNARLDPSKGPS